MKIAVVNHHGRTPGGSENSLLLLFERLRSEFDVEFILFERGEFFEMVTDAFGHAHCVPMADAVASSTRSRSSLRAIFESISLLVRLTRKLRELDVDLVLTNSMKAHVIGSPAAYLANVACINYFHDLPEGAALTLTRAISRLFSRARFACSQAVANHFGLPDTTVVHPAIVPERYTSLPSKSHSKDALGLPPDDLPVISLVGRIARWKGQDRFIRIAALVRGRVDARFLIVGGPVFGVDDDYLPELHAASEHLGLDDRLTFVPWTDDLAHVYGATDIAVNCSKREPFGRTTLEALASGIPSVCFDDGGTPEAMTAGVSGTCVAPGDDGEFARAIVSYLKSDEKLQSARKAAVADSLRFDIARLSNVFRDAVYAVVKRRPLPVTLQVAQITDNA